MLTTKHLLRFLAAGLCAGSLVLHAQPPHLQKQGTATQLIVDGRPFLVIGGELHNSSSSSLDYMRPIWPRLVALHLNTVLAAVTWETIEPEEGRFEFQLVDGLIQDARRHYLRLIFLWFGSWKNGMSSYTPLWVKRDQQRFPRAEIGNGETIEVLSTFSEASRDADSRAFAALMRHIREVDGAGHTVIMIQVENEVGVLGDSRDRGELADKAFAAPVPAKVIDYLKRNKSALPAEVLARWESGGFREAGSWEEVFGAGAATDEAFMAWNYATYIDHVAAAGKAEYDIPLFANAWLSGPDRHPGDWPSGGPLPHVMDLWKAGAPHLDFLSPDIYAANFADWCRWYTQLGNPLFIPETRRAAGGARNVLYAVGQHDAIGTSPFAIDSLEDPAKAPIGQSYRLLRQLAPAILQHQGRGEMAGVLLDKDHPTTTVNLGAYKLDVSLDAVFGYKADRGYGLIISLGNDEFLAGGTGFRIGFSPTDGKGKVGLGPIEEGEFQDGQWISGRRLNGDESDQGRRWRISHGYASGRLSIQRCKLYRYR